MVKSFYTSKLYSYFLVILQFSLIFLLGINANLINLNFFNFLMCLIGFLIGIWAIWVTRRAKITVLPEVRNGSTLITNGPYKFIRHPMYSAVLLFSLGLLFLNYNFQGAILFLLLFITLFFKIKYEERLLIINFEDYKNYKKRTKKLIPFIY